MRYCVNGRQPYSVINKADEIKFQYIDKDKILDMVEKYPEKIVILDVPGLEEDWANWQVYNEKFFEFHIALHDLRRANEFNEAQIKWYWPFPITSYYELKMIVNLHPSYLMIGPPLSFDLDHIVDYIYFDGETTPIPLRMVVNVAHPDYLPENGTHGVCGQWVRPEDAKLYSSRVQCFEFSNVDLKQEAIMLETYKEKQFWPGNISFLIQKLNASVDNRAIPEEFGARRMTCGHKCWSGSRCKFCVTAFNFADQIRKLNNDRRAESAIDNN